MGASRPVSQALARLVEPLFELDAGAGLDTEQERTAIQLDGAFGPALVDGREEVVDVRLHVRPDPQAVGFDRAGCDLADLGEGTRQAVQRIGGVHPEELGQEASFLRTLEREVRE